MSEQSMSEPYVNLGTHLKYLREQVKETVAEVSGAVEIDEEHLTRIEAGRERPAEDILMLLINHFDMADQEAIQLWELAGYAGGLPGQTIDPSNALMTTKPTVILLAIDGRTMYTDGLSVSTNQAGVTLQFTQETGQKQPLSIARLGMSYEQANQVITTLQQSLLHARYLQGPKRLPPASSS